MKTGPTGITSMALYLLFISGWGAEWGPCPPQPLGEEAGHLHQRCWWTCGEDSDQTGWEPCPVEEERKVGLINNEIFLSIFFIMAVFSSFDPPRYSSPGSLRRQWMLCRLILTSWRLRRQSWNNDSVTSQRWPLKAWEVHLPQELPPSFRDQQEVKFPLLIYAHFFSAAELMVFYIWWWFILMSHVIVLSREKQLQLTGFYKKSCKNWVCSITVKLFLPDFSQILTKWKWGESAPSKENHKVSLFPQSFYFSPSGLPPSMGGPMQVVDSPLLRQQIEAQRLGIKHLQNENNRLKVC